MLFKKIFNKIHDSEINCRIEWLWDNGFTWCVLASNKYPRILKDDELQGNDKIEWRSEKDFIEANNKTHEKDWITRGREDDIEDAFLEMIDAIIEHFPDSEFTKWIKDFNKNRDHFMICGICGDLIDKRDLGEVFEHEHKNGSPKINGDNFIAKREGDNKAWHKGKGIDLN